MTSQVRKRKTIDPCERCGLHRTICLCALIPKIDLRTRLTLIIHAKEMKRTTNTGRLALHALTNSEMVIRGNRGPIDQGGKTPAPPIDLSKSLLPGYRPLLFFPCDDSVELTPDFISSLAGSAQTQIQLLVPDGNWRQASKVHSRHPEISHVTRVKISTPNMAEKHLRAEHLPEGMSTLEAIARAIGIIESREAEELLLGLYREKLSRTLTARGSPG